MTYFDYPFNTRISEMKLDQGWKTLLRMEAWETWPEWMERNN